MLKMDYDRQVSPAKEATSPTSPAKSPARLHIADRKFATMIETHPKVSSINTQMSNDDLNSNRKGISSKNVTFADQSQFDAISKLSKTMSKPTEKPTDNLTLYEYHVRKYTSFFVVNSCQQSRTLIMNGLKNFKAKAAQRHLMFNLAFLSLDSQQFADAAAQYRELLTSPLRPVTQRVFHKTTT